MWTRLWEEMLRDTAEPEPKEFRLEERLQGKNSLHTYSGLLISLTQNLERWEVAYTALFLTSHESSYINAFTINMDAGSVVGLGRLRDDAPSKAQSKL